MSDLFQEIQDSRRKRSGGSQTFIKDGQLFANEKVLRGYEDAQKIKQMFSTAVDLGTSFVKNIPNIGIGVTKGILPGIANIGEEAMRTVLGGTITDMVEETFQIIPGYNTLNDYFLDATKPEGTAQEISYGLGEAGGQIVVPGALISKALKVYGYGSTFLRNVLGYGSAEAIGLKPEDEALIEMGLQVIKDDSQIAEEMLSSLSANKDLPYFMQKIQRMPLRMLEGGLLGEYAGKAIEGIGKVYSLVKNSPRLKSSLETIGTKAQESLDDGSGTTLSALGAGEMDKAINTQLAKLAPTNNVLDDTKTVLDARAKQMELNPADRVQPSGQDPLFDTTPQSYEQTLVKHEQKEIVLPRNNGEVATLPIRDRARAVLDNTDAIAQEIANSIKLAIGSNVQYFYHTAPLIEKAVALGIPEELAREQLFKFAQNYAVTSPRTTTDQNLRSASLVSVKETLGKDVTEILGPGGEGINEKGYPMMIGEGGIHKKLIDDKQAEGLNVNTNPKPVSFAENVSGNLKVVTVDTHAIRAVFHVMNKLNPGSVPLDFIGGKTPKKTKEFQEMYKNDPSSLDVATMIKDTLASQMINGQSMQTEYAVFADIYKKVAELAGVNPAEAQSLTWFSFGDVTGLASAPKTIVELIDDRVDVTSQLTGQSKEEVFKKFMQGGIPLASFGGLNLLDTGAEINLDEENMVA